MKVHLFPTIMTHKDDRIHVTFPDIHMLYTSGGTEEEAYSNGVSILRMYLEGVIERGDEIPQPSNVSTIVPESESHVVTLVHVII